MANNIPITTGSGSASVATETVGGISYQQVEIIGAGGASVLSINSSGALSTTLTGTPSISGAVTVIGTSSISGSVNVTGNPSISGAVQLAGASPASIMTITRIDNQIVGSMLGMVGQFVIHGLTSAGGGGYVDVKVDPSGALVTTASSVVSFQGGTWNASVSGTPNVAITSVATANGGLPIWSPLGSRIVGTADFRGNAGASIAVVAGAGASTRNYIDAVQVMNFGSASVLVTIADNTTSILGYTIAPAGGGSNYNPFYRGAANSPITASISGQASVLVSMQGFTSGT